MAVAPADQRDAVRKRSELDEKLSSGIDMCVSQCRTANNDSQIDCLIAAKTANQATEFLK